jgi:hypothetical protein
MTVEGTRELGDFIRFPDPRGGVIVFDRSARSWAWHATSAQGDTAMLAAFYGRIGDTLRSAVRESSAAGAHLTAATRLI